MGLLTKGIRIALLAVSVLTFGWLSASADAATQSGSLTTGEYRYYDITLPDPQSGLRLVLSTSASSEFHLYSGTDHAAGELIASSTNKTLHSLLVPVATLTDGGQYHVRIRANADLSYSYTSDPAFARDLTWDPGSTSGGIEAAAPPDTAGGDYLFRITSRTSLHGAWRTIIRNVSGGEADLYMEQGNPPINGGQYSSTRIGADGIILAAPQFGDNQEWYIRVHAAPGASWQLVSGDIYVQDLGAVTADGSGSSGSVTIGPEGTYYFRTSVDTDTRAWRLWLNGADLPIHVKQGAAPVSTSQIYHEQFEAGQMLLVPPYLTNATYLVGVSGAPGTVFAIDSRKQQVLVPDTLAGYAGEGAPNFAFTLPAQGSVGGYGYLTYRIDVPVDQIAWQVNITPTAGNPELYIRKGGVPNRWMNDGLSEAPAGVADSLTQVPPTLTDGAWYVTVYGNGSFSFTLKSQNPVITPKYFINTSDPGPVPQGYAYPYGAVPITNDDTDRSGWRYYQVSDINSQLGFLGWQLDLANHVAGSEIALRRNAVPARWRYRIGGSAYNTYVSEASHVDASSALGFLQHPNHQADIWYIGVHAPDQALGAFQLTTREIPAPLKNITGSSATVADQPAGAWKWYKFTVPDDPNILGWDLRLVDVVGGMPRMVVRRDQLPADLNTSFLGENHFTYTENLWQTGRQWGAGNDWTGRPNSSSTPPVDESGRVLVMGMGSPLEPGTYYVGVSGARDYSSNLVSGDPLGYTLQSRGIGTGTDLGGTPWPIQVQDLAFSGTGSSMEGTALQPREAAYYRFDVPAGAKSWSLGLVPTTGEALLAVRQGALPNVAAGMHTYPDSDSTTYYQGAKRQKGGEEFYYKYQPEGGAAITPGVYYVAVVSEGQNPADGSSIGTGGVDFTLTSAGEVPIADRTSTPLGAGSPAIWSGETLRYGEQKVYRFRVPAGISSLEVRLVNRVGNPVMSLRHDPAGSGRIPMISDGYSAEDGGAASQYGDSTLITVAQPAEGDYTLTVAADGSNDASFDVEVTARAETVLPFTNGSSTVTGQEAAAWRYFRVEVPSGAGLLGWDLRLVNVTGGMPRMVVRRDLMPSDFVTTYTGWYERYINTENLWESGRQWGAATDWTGRANSSAAPSVDESGRILAMGIGSPLEPGIYYVGVSVARDYANNPMSGDPLSYTLQSRGIGTGNDAGGTPWPIQVQDLAFSGAGSSRSGSNLAPREAAFYRVNVPAGAKSWSVNLEPAVGEALLAVRHGSLPNVSASSQNYLNPYSDSTTYFQGTKRQKDGWEFFFKYQPDGVETITPGFYYVAVVSEGVNPVGSSIGTGGVDYTLTSVGEMPIADKTGSPLTAEAPVLWKGGNPSDPDSHEALWYGQQKVYRFRVPAGISSLEVRLGNRTGNPVMSLRYDPAASGRIPMITESYSAEEGGAVSQKHDASLITVAQPAEGDYTLTVAADSLYADAAWTYPDASFDVEVTAQGETVVSFTGGSSTVTGQEAATWRYFRVEVPSDPNLLGWDLRLVNVTGGIPRIVVRRDQLPSDFATTYTGWFERYTNTENLWESGRQWGADTDWTGRPNSSAAPTVDESGRILSMGIGSPLEPGTYHVGVSVAHDYANNPMSGDPLSYTLQSRGIGTGNDAGGTPWPIQVQDLALSGAGGSSVGAGLAPREAAYYRVSVPEGTKSWAMVLEPTAGEALLAVRHGALPNVSASSQNYLNLYSDSTAYFQGTKRQKDGREFFFKYQPDGGATITPGFYYVAVVSEGQNPANGSTIGTGGAGYTLTSVGEMPIADKSEAPLAEGSPVTWSGESLKYGDQRVYRFRAPAGIASLEVRLKNRLGNPVMRLRQDPAGGGRIPESYLNYYPYRADEGGAHGAWLSNDGIITVPQPAEGDYTLTVAADYGDNSYPDASYDLEVSALVPRLLAAAGDQVQTGSLVNNQVAYYQVTIPDRYDDYPVVGWKVRVATTNGQAAIRASKDTVPSDAVGTLSSDRAMTTIVPPFLTPGTWYLEVKGNGLTDYTLASDVITAEPPAAAGQFPPHHSRTWGMPGQGGAFAQPGLQPPWFGDSGVDDLGQDIVNPSTGDLGVDLADGEYHYYRIIVPDNNGALLRTVVESLSGNPELYIRRGYPPSIDHKSHATEPYEYYAPLAYDRSQAVAGTMYGNWVPLDGRVDRELPPGDWWLAVRAVGSNIRYRLKVAAGNVRDDNGPLDAAGYVQDMAQDGGARTGQTLAAGDMRYYRMTVPQSDTTPAAGTPLNWAVNLQQQAGDVVVFIRDTIPPGHGERGNGFESYYQEGNPYFQDWYDDNSYQTPNPFIVLDEPGSHALALPPVEPGKTYYLGVYAKTDAIFDISSTIGEERLSLAGVIPFTDGTAGRTLAAGETALYRIDVPADAVYWRHAAVHDAGVELLIHEGTVPTDGYAHWTSNYCADYCGWQSDSSFNKYLFENASLDNYPWQPGRSYYLKVINTTGLPQPFTFTMGGRTAMSGLSVTMSGNGMGTVSDGSGFVCAVGACASSYVPYTVITLSPTPAPGSGFAGWGGACAGQGLNCTVTMDAARSVTATFTLNTHNLHLEISGTGGGSVNSSPSGIACTAGSCTAPFDYGTPVSLAATPDSGSLFAGWSGDCTGTGNCAATMDRDVHITAAFDLQPLVRIFGFSSVFSLLQDAYSSASNESIIQARSVEFTENLRLDRGISLVMKGGYDSAYSSNSGWTTIKGSVTVGTGSLTVENMAVK